MPPAMGEEGRKDTDKSWMWLRRGGPPGKTVVLYEYRQTRAAYHAKELLKGYCGFLQTDGYDAYNAVIKDMPGIILVGCFSHYPSRKIIREECCKSNSYMVLLKNISDNYNLVFTCFLGNPELRSMV